MVLFFFCFSRRGVNSHRCLLVSSYLIKFSRDTVPRVVYAQNELKCSRQGNSLTHKTGNGTVGETKPMHFECPPQNKRKPYCYTKHRSAPVTVEMLEVFFFQQVTMLTMIRILCVSFSKIYSKWAIYRNLYFWTALWGLPSPTLGFKVFWPSPLNMMCYISFKCEDQLQTRLQSADYYQGKGQLGACIKNV